MLGAALLLLFSAQLMTRAKSNRQRQKQLETSNEAEATSEVNEGWRELLIRTNKAEADGVLIAVSDSGPGLPKANPEGVFEPFYTTKTSGLGLGLSICRSIIAALSGRLWAAPKEPRGAAFFMTLPIGEGPLESSKQPEA
jgi:C4-dicarboxylate-specific signal transduction histidine kinase